MRLATLLPFILSLSAGPAGASELQRQVRGFSDFFDAGIIRPSQGFMPAIPVPKHDTPAASEWPAIIGVPVTAPAEDGRDVFRGQEACVTVDAVNVRQPTLEEALRELSACLKTVSKRYSVEVNAVKDGKAIVLVISGLIPEGNTLAADLAFSLGRRKGQLFGHPARLGGPAAGEGEPSSRVSSLQLVIDHCPTIALVRDFRTAKDFLSAYGACLKQANGLAISELKPDSSDAKRIVIYCSASSTAIREMNGFVSVPSENGKARFSIFARRQGLTDSEFLPPSAF